MMRNNYCITSNKHYTWSPPSPSRIHTFMKTKNIQSQVLHSLEVAEREGYAPELVPKRASNMSKELMRDIRNMSLSQNVY